MESISFTYNFNDEGASHAASISFSGEYINLETIAREFKDFLNAAGFVVDSLVINDTFGIVEDPNEV
jgi:hypothetical protein